MFHPDTIHIGFAHDKRVEARFCLSLAKTMRANQRIIGITGSQNARQHVARNDIVREFLRGEAEWLLEIDTDMEFDLHAARRIMEAATEADAKVVHGEAFGYNESERIVNFPVFLWDEAKSDYVEYPDPPWGTRFWVDACGAAFLLLHRSVLEAVGDPWHENYMEHPATGKPMGHDIALHHRIRQTTGERTLYCSDIQIGHVKQFVVDRDTYLSYLEAQ